MSLNWCKHPIGYHGGLTGLDNSRAREGGANFEILPPAQSGLPLEHAYPINSNNT